MSDRGTGGASASSVPGRGRYATPPPEMVAAAERDYREARHQLDALIVAAQAVRSQHDTELNLFVHLYATIRPVHPTRATALAAVAVLQLATDGTNPSETSMATRPRPSSCP